MRSFFSDKIKKLAIYFDLYDSSLSFSRREDQINIIIVIIIVIIVIIIIIIIIISNFFFVGIIQLFKKLQIGQKANSKPSKVLKDTFQQSFKLNIH